MRYLMLLAFGLAWTAAQAGGDTSWHAELAQMTAAMRDVRFESYAYRAETHFPKDTAQIQQGRFYLNRPDTMLYHLIGPVTMTLTTEKFLRRDDKERMITFSRFTTGSAGRRKQLLDAFFDTDELLSQLGKMLEHAKLLSLDRSAAALSIRLEITDGFSHQTQVSIVIDAKSHLPKEIRYDVTRHTEFRKSDPATDYRQMVRCYDYRWTRDAAAERLLSDAAKSIEEKISTNTYKVTQL